MNPLLENFRSSLEHSFLDNTQEYSDIYKAKLLVNSEVQGKFVLNELKEELTTCEEFFFAVAFITESGLAALKIVLSDLNRRGIKGRIITSDYLYFNSPKMFRELLKLKNVEIRVIKISGFHVKGYYFAHQDYETMILGSSNLTIKALKVNYEWNLKLNSLANGDLIQEVKKNFEEMWIVSFSLTQSWIEEYSNRYRPIINTKIIDTSRNPVVDFDLTLVSDEDSDEQYVVDIEPNEMQKNALRAINKIRSEGKDKGLVVSATGTGKTYLSAFDVKAFKPKRMLFVVHQELILKKAMKDYHSIVGGIFEEDYGILSGGHSIQNEKYVFATIQSLSKDENLNYFSEEDFDYILIDEVHKAGAASYQKVINYFKPKFLLGMTATPERTDGFNIYELFDYNLAYEIRLQEALKEDMLCPFHYFGITDLELESQSENEYAAFAQLIPDERADYIFEQIEYYGYSGEAVKGLIFCSKKKEAYELEKLFCDRGFRAKALTGEYNMDKREEAIRQLVCGTLDYIITVDIFNEGVDIPPVNQVVMLRKTESSIIFTQQLGRGLRKAKNKEFVTIIDFIGNYDNNYLIPVALTEDSSLNKNELRKKTMGMQYLSGVSTINFDEIAQKKIFDSIEFSNLKSSKNFREAYLNLKYKLGRVPKLLDFIEQESIDPVIVAAYKGNYAKFLSWIGDSKAYFSEREKQILTFLSTEFLNGKRNHEMLLLSKIMEKDGLKNSDYLHLLKSKKYPVTDLTMTSIQRIFNMSYFTQTEQTKYGKNPIIILKNEVYYLSEEFKYLLENNSYFEGNVKDIITTSFERSQRYSLAEQLTYNEIYTRKDVCRLLDWENNESGAMFGYSIKYKTCPIFINYHKDSDSVNYDDEFINRSTLMWSSKKSRDLESKDVRQILNYQTDFMDVHIFIRKKSEEKISEFIYLGRAFPKIESAKNSSIIDNGKEEKVVLMEMKLEKTIPLGTYDFITKK